MPLSPLWYSPMISRRAICVSKNLPTAQVVKDDSYAAALVGSLTIPESVMNDGVSYSVAEIDYRAFAQCQALTSVVIPNSLKVVGGSAFYMCKALTSVTLGSSVEKIDVDAFYNTLALKSITLPNSLKTIGEGAFGYSGITSIEIPDAVTSLGE